MGSLAGDFMEEAVRTVRVSDFMFINACVVVSSGVNASSMYYFVPSDLLPFTILEVCVSL